MKTKTGEKSNLCEVFCSSSRGVILASISGLLFSLATVIVKYLRNIHPGQLSAYRYYAVASFSLPHLIPSRQNFLGPPGHRILMLILAVIGTITIFLQFVAFRYLPVGEAAAVISCYPVFVTVAGKIFLNESFGLLHVISLLTTTGGILLTTGFFQTFNISTRVYSADNVYGLVAGLASLLSATAMFILARKLRNIHSFVILCFSGTVGVVVSVILTAVVGEFSLNYRGMQQYLLILLGLLSHGGLVSMIVAMKYEEAGPVSTMRAGVDIFFSLVWQALIFKDVPDVAEIIGAVLVCISIVLIGFNHRIGALLPQKCSVL